MFKQKLIEPKHEQKALYWIEYMPSYDLYFVHRTSDNEIVLRTSYRSEANLYNGLHISQ